MRNTKYLVQKNAISSTKNDSSSKIRNFWREKCLQESIISRALQIRLCRCKTERENFFNGSNRYERTSEMIWNDGTLRRKMTLSRTPTHRHTHTTTSQTISQLKLDPFQTRMIRTMRTCLWDAVRCRIPCATWRRATPLLQFSKQTTGTNRVAAKPIEIK